MKKSLSLLTTMALAVSFSASATTYPPKLKHTDEHATEQLSAITSPMNVDGLVFLQEPTENAAEATVTDVLFYYQQEALDIFDGDTSKLVEYVEKSIELNNEAFRLQDIQIRRRIAAILPLPETVNYSLDWEYEDRMKAISSLALSAQSKSYDASYTVLVQGYNPEVDSVVGRAEVGGNSGYIVPWLDNLDFGHRTIMHELGHMDGLHHDDALLETNASSYLERYAMGTQCGTVATVMSVEGDRNYHFFSSPDVTYNSIACGTAGVHDSAEAYRIAVNGGDFVSRIRSFSNIVTAKEQTGSVSLSLINEEVSEADEYFEFSVVWEAPTVGDSVTLMVSSDDATSDDFAPLYMRVEYSEEKGLTENFAVPVFDNDVVEDNKNITVKLIHPNGVALSDIDSEATVVLTSEDVEPEPVVATPIETDSDDDEGGSGGGSMSWLLLLLGTGLAFIRRK